nr:SOS response-associated peptidase [Acidiferrobacterales bacterium]
PYYITDAKKGALLIAGLFDAWGESQKLSCTILTRPANPLLSKIHHRMPIILNTDSAQQWLFEGVDMERLSAPKIEYYPVSKAVGSVKNDTAKLIERIQLSSG